MLEEKDNYKNLGILEVVMTKQTEMKEKKKKIPQKCYILTLDRAVNQEMHLCKQAEEQRKHVYVRQLYNQVPEAIRASWSQLGTRCRRASGRQRALGPQ